MIVIICTCLVAGIFLLDNMIKNRIEKDSNLPRSLWNGRIYIQKYHNSGVFRNILGKHPEVVKVLSVIMTLILLVCFILSLGHKGNNLLRIGLAALLGGAFSNTYDRVKRKYVVDYVSFPKSKKPISGLVYNISDFFIMIGSMLSCIGSLK